MAKGGDYPSRTTVIRSMSTRLIGIVASDRCSKTRRVEVEQKKRHPKYEKTIRRTLAVAVHDEFNESRVGDTVEIIESRPRSRTKRHSLVRIIKKGPHQVFDINQSNYFASAQPSSAHPANPSFQQQQLETTEYRMDHGINCKLCILAVHEKPVAELRLWASDLTATTEWITTNAAPMQLAQFADTLQSGTRRRIVLHFAVNSIQRLPDEAKLIAALPHKVRRESPLIMEFEGAQIQPLLPIFSQQKVMKLEEASLESEEGDVHLVYHRNSEPKVTCKLLPLAENDSLVFSILRHFPVAGGNESTADKVISWIKEAGSICRVQVQPESKRQMWPESMRAE